jgi:hypothetical protein
MFKFGITDGKKLHQEKRLHSQKDLMRFQSSQDTMVILEPLLMPAWSILQKI